MDPVIGGVLAGFAIVAVGIDKRYLLRARLRTRFSVETVRFRLLRLAARSGNHPSGRSSPIGCCRVRISAREFGACLRMASPGMDSTPSVAGGRGSTRLETRI